MSALSIEASDMALPPSLGSVQALPSQLPLPVAPDGAIGGGGVGAGPAAAGAATVGPGGGRRPPWVTDGLL